MNDSRTAESNLTEQSLMLQLQALGHLPTPSSAALRLYQLIQSEDSEIPEIAAAIKGDVSLTVRLLHIANRPCGSYVRRSVASIEEALMRVGTQSVAALAVGLSVLDDAQTVVPSEAKVYLGFCRRALAAAVVAEWLASQPGVPVNAADLFTCALLARIGQLALLRFYPQSYADLMGQEGSSADLLARERNQLGIDHQVITLALLREWGFPDVLIKAIRLSEEDHETEWDNDRLHRMGQLLQSSWEIAPALEWQQTLQLGPHIQRTMAVLGHTLGDSDIQAMVTALLSRWREWEGMRHRSQANTVSSNMPDESRFSVLLVGVAPSKAREWSIALAEQSFATASVATHQEVIPLVAVGQIDVIVLQMPDAEQPWSSTRRQLISSWLIDMPREALIILPDGENDAQVPTELLDVGIGAVLPSDVSGAWLVAQVKRLANQVTLAKTLAMERQSHRRVLSELVSTTRKLHTQTLTDPLTGLSNRRMADAFLKRHWAQLERRQTPLSCLIIDLDNFKQINDQFGHDAGDMALRTFSAVLKHQVRQEDLAVRLGGDEFLVVCPLARQQDLEMLRQRLLGATAQLKLDTGPLQFSMGIAESDLSWMKSPEDLLKKADLHLMENKRQR